MSLNKKDQNGKIDWTDLTVPDADIIIKFKEITNYVGFGASLADVMSMENAFIHNTEDSMPVG
jgi:hypothetical protein